MTAFDRRGVLGLGLAAAAAPLWARGPASYPAPTREAMLPVPGGRVYVRVNGRLGGPRPPVVFIHGGPGGTHAGLLDTLALADAGPDSRAIILYDQLDCGRSERPEDPANWTVPRFVEELEAVRRGMGVARWHVVGHSWGGTIALEYGARRPKELSGLVLASPLISTRSWIADANLLRTRLPASVQRDLTACEGPTPPSSAVCEAATEAFYDQFNQRVPPSDGQLAYIKGGNGRGNRRLYETMWGSSEFVSTGTLKDYDGEPLLAQLPGGRTLFLCGQHDEARPETLERFALRVPEAEFGVVPGASHSIFEDRTSATLGMLRPWLASKDAA